MTMKVTPSELIEFQRIFAVANEQMHAERLATVKAALDNAEHDLNTHDELISILRERIETARIEVSKRGDSISELCAALDERDEQAVKLGEMIKLRDETIAELRAALAKPTTWLDDILGQIKAESGPPNEPVILKQAKYQGGVVQPGDIEDMLGKPEPVMTAEELAEFKARQKQADQ